LFDTSCAPLELTVDLDGALLVVHDNGSVYRVDPSTGFRTIVANFNDRTLEDVAVERSGAMLITDSMELPSLLGRILRNAPSVGTEIVSDFADPQQGPLGQPRRMTVDHAGTIFVTTWGIPIIRIDALTGTRRILDMACVLATSPQVLLLDEPSSGVAQREAEAFPALIQRIKTETGCSVLIIEHDMPLITAVSDGSIPSSRARLINRPDIDIRLGSPKRSGREFLRVNSSRREPSASLYGFQRPVCRRKSR